MFVSETLIVTNWPGYAGLGLAEAAVTAMLGAMFKANGNGEAVLPKVSLALTINVWMPGPMDAPTVTLLV
jgi:hypothetical protein